MSKIQVVFKAEGKQGRFWFLSNKKYPKIFVHISTLKENGLSAKDMKKGESYWVNVKKTPKGVQAESIQLFDSDTGGIMHTKNFIPNNKIEFPSYQDSLDIQKTKSPQYLKRLNINKIDNFNLKFNKAARWDNSDNKFAFFKKGKKKVDYCINAKFDQEMIESIVNRYTSSIQQTNLKVKKNEFEPEWRAIVGLGKPSVYEVSITLHHIYGIPYIPSSGIKGAFRSWFINEHFDSKEELAIQNKGFCKIFGCPETVSKNSNSFDSYYKKSQKGKITFFDAFPVNTPNIVPDIMTPHYKEYYSDGKPPGDYYSPNPIPFLTVKDTPFRFIYGIDPNISNETIEIGKLKGEISEILQNELEKALTLQGLGAKTSVGYGYFNPKN